MTGKTRLVAFSIIGCIALAVVFVYIVSASAGGSSAVATRYLTAVQHGDVKTIINLTAYFQGQVKGIKANNPQALWSKLIDQYYAAETATLSQPANAMQSLSENMNAWVGDPTAGIRGLFPFLPQTAKWSITEARPLGNGQTAVYATVKYIEPGTSPVLGQQRLKETILQVNVLDSSMQVLAVGRVGAGDVYWPIPTLSSDEAERSIKTHWAPTVLSPYLRCNNQSAVDTGQMGYCVIRMPQNTTPWLKEYVAFYEKHGFSLKEFKINEGWGLNVAEAKPPDSWSNLVLTSDKNSTSFRLPENTQLTVSGIQQQGGRATATARLVHSGCTAACTMMRDYWQQSIASHIVGNTDPFFLVHWHGKVNEEPIGVDGGKWPTQEDRLVQFSWEPRTLSWQVTGTSEVDQKF